MSSMHAGDESEPEYNIHPEGINHEIREVVSKRFTDNNSLTQSEVLASLLNTVTNQSKAFTSLTEQLKEAGATNSKLRTTISDLNKNLEVEKTKLREEKLLLTDEMKNHMNTKEKLHLAEKGLETLRQELEKMKNRKSLVIRMWNTFRE